LGHKDEHILTSGLDISL